MDPQAIVATLALSALGALLGAGCALVPGLHANTLALLLLASYPALSPTLALLLPCWGEEVAAPIAFAFLLVSAATAHSFSDFLPSTFLGAPGEDTVLSMLPAHRMLASGQGLEAVQCAASGSLRGALLALLLAAPLLLLFRPPSPAGAFLDLLLPYLLLGVVALLVLTERGGRPRAYLDARQGALVPGLVCISPPLPVHGAPGSLTGQAARRRPRSFQVRTRHGTWKVAFGPRPPAGTLTITGTWVVRRPSLRARLTAAGLILLSGLLGLAAMDARPPLSGTFDGWGQSMLFPLLSGLFALPALLASMGGGPVPEQAQPSAEPAPLLPALGGALSGFLSGWLPGITSTIGTVIGTTLCPRPRDRERATREYIHMLSAVGTSAVVFSLLALAAEGQGRTGAMLALKEALGPPGLEALSGLPGQALPLLLLCALVASFLGYVLTLRAGRWMALGLAGRDLRWLNLAVLFFLLSLVLLCNGLPGLPVAGAACLVGLLPPRLGVRRVHLTGCLLLPLLLFLFGLEPAALDLLW